MMDRCEGRMENTLSKVRVVRDRRYWIRIQETAMKLTWDFNILIIAKTMSESDGAVGTVKVGDSGISFTSVLFSNSIRRKNNDGKSRSKVGLNKDVLFITRRTWDGKIPGVSRIVRTIVGDAKDY